MRAALALLLLPACTVEEWRNADLQLDVSGADWGGYDRARICVAGVGQHEAALGAGKLAFTGLPAGAPLAVTVDLLAESEDTASGAGVRVGRAGPIDLSADAPWAKTGWEECDPADDACDACAASGDLAAAGDPSWLLAVRFQ